MTDAGPFEDYLRVQAHNLVSIRRLPHFTLVERVSQLYDRSFAALSPDTSGLLLQLLVACHQALLSAAATIGRALPVDSIGVTRRAAEIARIAAAIKYDPANRDRWLATDVRLSRWADRFEGRKPARQPKGDIVYPPSAAVESLGRHIGMMSDAGAHFTPEFFGTLDRRVRDEPSSDGRVEVRFGYFETSQEAIERSLLNLATVHLLILFVFDECCFEGAFRRDAEWSRLHWEIGDYGKPLAQALLTSEADAGEDEDQP